MGAVTKDISFKDPDGKVVHESWWFQIDESDAAEMDIIHELFQKGDPTEELQRIVKEKDSRALLRLWKELLLASVCKREGNLLVKDGDILRQFKYGGAYRVIFTELITSDDAGASFFNEIMPSHVKEKAQAQASRVYTNEELLAMKDEAFYKAAGTSDLRDMDKRFMTLAMQRLSEKRFNLDNDEGPTEFGKSVA